MALILNIETATRICSVSLGKDGKLLVFRETAEDKSHARTLTVFIEELFKETGLPLRDLDAAAVSKGPGSYTGLRIGTSTAKGLCYSLDKPLIGISTLKAMASGRLLDSPLPSNAPLLCPMIDARRMEVYASVYDSSLNEVKSTEAVVIDSSSYEAVLSRGKMLFFGDGAAKCRAALGHHANALFDLEFQCSARHLVTLSEAAFRENNFEDTAYFEPFYLKDFIAGVSKKRIV